MSIIPDSRLCFSRCNSLSDWQGFEDEEEEEDPSGEDENTSEQGPDDNGPEADASTPRQPAYNTPPTGPGRRLPDLPSEILNMILNFATGHDFRVPSAISQVNQRLSAVARNQRSLWNVLDITNFWAKSSPLPSQARRFASTMSFSLQPVCSTPEGFGTIGKFIKAYTRSFRRIRALEAVYTDVGWGRRIIQFLQLYSHNLSQLQVLDLGLLNCGDERLEVKRVTALSGLRELCVRHLQFAPEHIPTFALLLRLQVIGCMTESFSELPGIIPQMPLLEELEISDTFLSEPIPEILCHDYDAVEVPSLLKLTLRRTGVGELQRIFAGINPINLTSLIISRPWHGKGEEGRYVGGVLLLRVLERHRSIQCIGLDDCGVEGDWPRFYASIPDVRHIQLALGSLTNSDLQPLIGVQGQPVLCPQLHTLVIYNTLNTSTTVIKDIALFRAQNSMPLQWIVLQGWDPTNVDDDEVCEIRESGILVDVGTLNVAAVHEDMGNITLTSVATEEDPDLSTGMTSGDWSVMN